MRETLNRRRFLKYAGATAAVVGASAVGLGYVARQNQNNSLVSLTTQATSLNSTASNFTTTHEVTAASSSSSTSSYAAQLASVTGRVFFDYTGNGKQDGGEPGLPGVLVQLKDKAGNVVAENLTNLSGDYRFQDLKAGPYLLHISGKSLADKTLRYMCTSPDEFRAAADDYEVSPELDSTVNIGLMEGFLTSPLREGTSFHFNAYFDDDRSSGIRDWKGGNNTVNGHEGTDFGVPIGTPVFSAAPGIVKYVDDWGPIGIFVIVSHDPYVRNMSTLYAHLSNSNVEEGQSLQRGAKLGESGQDKTHPGPHLHFELDFGFHGSPQRNSPYQPVDPFRAIWNPTAIGYWTNDNGPQYAKISY